MKKNNLLLIMLCSPILLWAQIDTTSFVAPDLIDQIEDRLETSDAASSQAEDWIEEMPNLAQDGLYNLNQLSYEIAISILHLTDYQYYQLQLYLELYGEMVSIYELIAVDGFTQLDFQRLEPYLKVQPVPQKLHFFRNFFPYSKSTLWIRYGQTVEKAIGYDTSQVHHYAGSPGRWCFRYNFSTQDKLFLKIAGEKDAGEQFFRGEQRQGFDFYAGSICVKNIGILKTAVLGDFRLNFGQGLVAGSSLLSGKGFDMNSIRKFSTAVQSVAPTNESTFLRGSAITLGKTKFNGTLFGAKRIGHDGYTFGTDLLYRHALFKIGLRAVFFGQDSTEKQSQTHQLFSKKAVSTFDIGLDYQVLIKQNLLFGEIAVNESGHIGALQGGIFNLTPVAKVAILFRYYNKAFTAPLGKAFGTNSVNSGEMGCYIIGQYILNRNWEINLYGDYYKLLWLSYYTDAPAVGTDIGVSLLYRISRNNTLALKYWWKIKEENQNNTPYYKTIQEHQRHKMRLTLTQYPFSFIKATTEVDWQLNCYPFSSTSHKGLLIFQDISFDMAKWNTTLRLRIAYFDTDRYEDRLYAYEHDVYYAFTIGSYYYKGVRGYLVLRYQYRWLSFWLRIAQTYYFDKTSVGSGLNQINQPHKTDIRAQVMFSF